MSGEQNVVWLPRPWMPDDLDRAVRWFRSHHRSCLLFAPMMDGYDGELGGFRRQGRQFSLRSKQPHVGQGDAVVCHAPDLAMLTKATRYVERGVEVFVIDWGHPPILGWARAVGAVNYATGEPEPPFDDATADLIRSLVFVGNNGWADAPGKRDAQRLVGQAAGEGVLTREVISAVVAHGVSSDAVKRLDKIVSQHLPPDPPWL